MPPGRASNSIKAGPSNLGNPSTAQNGTETAMDVDAPREGRLPTLKPPRDHGIQRGSGTKLIFKPKIVARKRREGSESLLDPAPDHGDGSGRGRGRDTRLGRGTRGGLGGRGRGGLPLVASGPFAQGPAGPAPGSSGNTRHVGLGSSSSSPSVSTNLSHTTPTAPASILGVPIKKEGKRGFGFGRGARGVRIKGENGTEEIEEIEFDESGNPMINIQRVKFASHLLNSSRGDVSMTDGTEEDFWAPISTERIERKTHKSRPVALEELENSTIKSEKIKVEGTLENEFVGVRERRIKTEAIESGFSTPQDESREKSEEMEEEEEEEDDILPPSTVPVPISPADLRRTKVDPAISTKIKKEPKPKRENSDLGRRILSQEEQEEEERYSQDLESLRLGFGNLEPADDESHEKLLFIQLPVVLPFFHPPVDVVVKEEEKVKVDEVEELKPDPESKTPASENSTPKPQPSDPVPASLEKKEDADEEAEVKPSIPDITPTAPNPKKKKVKPIAFPAPEGKVGSLNVHRSGKVTMDWGGIKMDINVGSECGFLQEAVVMNSGTDRKVWVLGRIGGRLLASPNLDSLL